MTCKLCEERAKQRQEQQPPKSPKLAACQECPALVRFHAQLPRTAPIGLLDRCGECGCFIRAKAALNFDCPLGKWSDDYAIR